MLTPSPHSAASRTLLVGGMPPPPMPVPPASASPASPALMAPPPPVPREPESDDPSTLAAEAIPEDWSDFTSMAVSTCVHGFAFLFLALFVPLYDTNEPPVQIISSFEDAESDFDDIEPLPLEMVADTPEENLDPPLPEIATNVAVDPADIDATGTISENDMTSFAGPMSDVMAGADTMLADFGSVRAGGGPGGGGGGFGGEIGKRLAKAGAKSGDIQVSLAWNNLNDLDLHVVAPSGERVYFAFPRSNCGGHLDVDMNAGGKQSNQPVENVYWPRNGAPAGSFQVFVNYFDKHDAVDETHFEVHLLIDGVKKSYKGRIRLGESAALAAEFSRGAGASGNSADDGEFRE